MFEVGLAHAHPDEPEHVDPGGGGGAAGSRVTERGGGEEGGPTGPTGEGRRLCNRSVVTASQTHVTASSFSS